MIKDVFVFSKNSWHMKLMNWIWGYTHTDFPNMCPYFWLSVLNIIILPFVVLFKALRMLVFFIHDRIINAIADYAIYCEERFDKWAMSVFDNFDSMLDSKNVDLNFLRNLDDYHYRRKHTKYYKLWNRLTDTQRERMYLIIQKAEEEKERIEAEKEKERLKKKAQTEKKFSYIKNNRKTIGQMTVWIKKAAVLVGGAIVAYLGYLFVKLMMYVHSRIDWPVVWKYTVLISIILGVIVLVVAVGFGLFVIIRRLWCKYGEFCVPCERRREKIGDFILALCRGIAYPFVMIGYGVKNVWDFAMAMKNDNCPAIEWKEDKE